MSFKVFKKDQKQTERCGTFELRSIQKELGGVVHPTQDYSFEKTGFLSGFDETKERLTPQDIIKKANKRADEIAQEAYKKGFEQGEKDGFEFGNKKAESVAQDLLNLLSELSEVREEILRQSEIETVKLAMSIASRIINHELKLQEDLILHVVKDSLQSVTSEDRIQIYLHPDDALFLEKSKEDLTQSLKQFVKIELHPDESIRRGGCLLKTRMGEVDSRIDEKIERLFKQLMDTMKSKTPES